VFGEPLDHFRFCQHPIHDKPGRLKIVEAHSIVARPRFANLIYQSVPFA
jgi:hypothetical protein